MDSRAIALQYGTSANLAARIALHQRCSTNPYGLQRWVFDRLGLAPGQRVLEVACGTGSLWRENADRIPEGLDLVLSDISLGMVLAAGGRRSVVCSLPDLPFADGTFDLVIANHMLYHVADRERGLTDIRRVLRKDGRLFAATNGREHLREIKNLMQQFAIDGSDISASFTMENGEEQLRRVFGHIERDDYPDSLRVPDPDLLLGYITSIGTHAREAVEARGEEMRSAIEARIARDGAFYVVKSTGAFVARNG